MSWGFHLLSSSLLMSWHKQQSREQLKCVGSCTMGEAWRKLLAPDFGGPAPTSSSRWRASAYGKFFLCLCNYVASEFKTKGVSASMLSPERGFCFSGSLRRTSPTISPPPPMLYRGLLGPAPGQCPADPAPLHASQGAARISSRPVPCWSPHPPCITGLLLPALGLCPADPTLHASPGTARASSRPVLCCWPAHGFAPVMMECP